MTINFSLDSPPPPSPFQRWATEQLGLSSSASATDARNALRDRLRDEDFVPPLRWQQAVQVYCGSSKINPAAFLDNEAERLEGEMAEFAAQFFDLPPAERRARWHNLLDQCPQYPLLQARLEHLRAGLDYQPLPRPLDPVGAEVAATARELFVLPNPQRAARRQAYFASAGDRIGGYIAAIRRVLASGDDLGLLEPHFVDTLLKWKKRQRAARQRRLRYALDNASGLVTTVSVIVALLLTGLLIAAPVWLSNRPSSDLPPPPLTHTVGAQIDLEKLFGDAQQENPPPEMLAQYDGLRQDLERVSVKESIDLRRLREVLPALPPRGLLVAEEVVFLRTVAQDRSGSLSAATEARLKQLVFRLDTFHRRIVFGVGKKPAP